jgi:hypothetical protein
MTKISGQAQSFVPKEPLEVQIVESYSAADRNDLAGGEKDPSQTSAYQLQWRPTEKHVLVVEGRKRVCHVGSSGRRLRFRGISFPWRGLAEYWHGANAGGGILPYCDGRGKSVCVEARWP